MKTYKVYCFDGRGDLWIEDEIEAATDEEAVEVALSIEAAVKLEVRDQQRIVAVVDRTFPTA